MMLRSDIDTILDWVTQGSRVLDLGCGDGELLAALTKQKAISGLGVDIDAGNLIAAVDKVCVSSNKIWKMGCQTLTPKALTL